VATNRWRLIKDTAHDGAWNMAVDEAIREFTAKHIVHPTLRLYSWEPYTLSLGRAQPVADADTDKINTRKWGLVRRPTGGRAILHADELTYAVCAPEDDEIVHGGVLESYRKISRGLLEALAFLGITADSLPKSNRLSERNPNPVCFQDPSDYEITFGGMKIIGSAQARRNQGILQHGAIPLFGDISRITQVLSFSEKGSRVIAAANLKERAATLTDIIGKKVSRESVSKAIELGFSKAHQIEWMEGSLTIGETKLAQELFKNKYANSVWTYKI
jgi:lipoate-protein ligase A